ncbi:hypothetical protein J6590_015248 [Homalodisca vitripennis]|nr:hypothetical protein J6590_015248 [Homalodisca vitripennis]
MLVSYYKFNKSQYSWVVRIYYKTGGGRYEMRCGGILIYPHTVVTAAHCVVNETNGNVIALDSIKVGIGKYYSEYFNQEASSVISEVYCGCEGVTSTDVG